MPKLDYVVDYFRWRSEDAHRNALNGHCYWMLRRQGKGATDATGLLEGLSVADKNELLFDNGINFNDLPNWQKRGVGLFWEDYTKEGTNPLTNETVAGIRRRVKIEMDLPMRDEYANFIKGILTS